MSARTKVTELVLGGEPRVDLLPPEVELLKKARAQRRILGLLVVLAIVAVAAAFGLATLRATAAQLGLASAQERTLALIDEQAQYAEAARVTRVLSTIEQTRAESTQWEIVWADVLDAVSAVTSPSGFASWNATSRVPWEPELTPSGPLREPRVGTLVFTVVSDLPIDARALMAALGRIEGVVDASLDVRELVPDTGKFQTTITLNLGADALADRFPLTEVSE